MKNFKNYLCLGLALTFAVVLLSCSKIPKEPPSNGAHNVVFKVEASAGSNLLVANYGYDGKVTQVGSLSGSTWTSPEIVVPAGTIVLAGGAGGNGASAASTIKMQIYVDGVLKKESTGSGTSLTVAVTHTF
ncbi:hypothetical protein [Pedobacter sp. Hv1]|uniref:hypothetical protein n=1 Tax=Pedobacter sp. Hv1 TaxID=1740090 RepID=UPI0006D8BCD7|nr:hypothetical protein [Pedobacter sp. Hv1]KQC02746.1 hypothetical protein AQF98_04005 [Pedobacter sp. Hv1]